MSVPIDITDDTLASSLVPVQCASLAPPALFKKGRRQKKKKEVLHLSRCYTHTHSLTHPLTHSLRRGTMCTAKGSDVRPGVPLASLGLRFFCVAGVGQCALPRGRMYARGSAGVPGSPPLLRGRRGTMCTVKGSDVRPGVPLASLGLRLFCVAGVGQCALPRGRMYAPGFRWRPWVSASFAWQAWDNVHCQGVGCTPRVPLASLGLRLFCVAGVGQCALSRGRMYTPGFRWRPWVSASFAWQAWDNVHCQGVGCTPRGSAGVPGSPLLLRGRRGTMCTHALTHSLTHSPTHSLIHSLTRLLTRSLTHSHIPHSHTPHSHHSLTLSLTHLYMHIHTHTQTHPPSPLHHSYPSSSLLAFLCSV